MSDIIDELDEHMRAEKWQEIWQKHGSFIIAVIAAIIIATGAGSWYKSHKYNQRVQGTAALLETVNAENFPQNVNDTKIEADDDIKALAYLNAAGKLIEQEKPLEAAEIYTKIIALKGVNKNLKSLAMLSRYRINPAENQADIEKIAGDEESPYQYQALIEQAQIFAQKGEYDQAITALDKVISDPDQYDTLISRAELLKTLYISKRKEA